MNDNDIKTNLSYYSDYFEALFFAEFENKEVDFTDINKDCLIKQFEQLDKFFEKANCILDNTEYTHEQACHDFYFTRNGHGVGFWENDFCNETQGRQLTEIAKSMGESYTYQGDDGKIYID